MVQRKYLLTLLFLSVCFVTLGQSRIGVVIGLNSGKFRGDSPPGGKYVAGSDFMIGGSFDYQVKERIFLSVAPSYIYTQSKIQFPKLIEEEGEIIEVYEDSIHLKFQMLSIPLLLKLVSENNKWEFTGGFEIAFPTKLNASNTNDEDDLLKQVKGTNVNMLFGIGYRIPINRHLLSVILAYSQGLTNVANNFDDPDALLPRVRFTYFQISAAWTIPFGKNRFSQSQPG